MAIIAIDDCRVKETLTAGGNTKVRGQHRHNTEESDDVDFCNASSTTRVAPRRTSKRTCTRHQYESCGKRHFSNVGSHELILKQSTVSPTRQLIDFCLDRRGSFLKGEKANKRKSQTQVTGGSHTAEGNGNGLQHTTERDGNTTPTYRRTKGRIGCRTQRAIAKLSISTSCRH